MYVSFSNFFVDAKKKMSEQEQIYCNAYYDVIFDTEYSKSYSRWIYDYVTGLAGDIRKKYLSTNENYILFNQRYNFGRYVTV